jgi:spore germination cell wall hydrolase CwlJ-like protein
MKIKLFLISLVIAVSSTAVAAQEVQVAQVSFSDQIVDQANRFVERTVNMIATPFLSDKDVECLARNIFYESGGESVEGKVAVAMVTLNRTQNPNYPSTVCDVVKQRTVKTVQEKVTTVRHVKVNWVLPPQPVEETQLKTVNKVVCQFSWTCMRVPKIKEDDPRWIESRAVAETIARNGYPEWQDKYREATHFHAVYVKPGWKLKRIARTGNHIFYQ